MKPIETFFMTFSMFCAVPCPYRPWREEYRGSMLLYLPAVGAVIGALWLAAVRLCAFFELPIALAAVVIACAPYLLTGFFHLDGFLDTNDALLSRRDREERLRILKDSRVGAFAVIMFGILLLTAFAAGLTFASGRGDARLFVPIPICSRIAAALAMTCAKPLSHSQYSSTKRGNPPVCKMIVLALWLVLTFSSAALWLGKEGVIVCAVTTAGYALFLLYAAHDLGGVSGDLSGYALTLGELAGLIACSLL